MAEIGVGPAIGESSGRGGGVGSAVGLAALVTALVFDFRVEAGKGGALAFGIFVAIELGKGFGEIEMHFRAAGIETGGRL